MAANPIQPDPTIEYPEKWTPMQHKCACGTNVRVDVEFIAGMSAMQVFQHCAKDEGEYYPQIIAAWEERDATWVRLQESALVGSEAVFFTRVPVPILYPFPQNQPEPSRTKLNKNKGRAVVWRAPHKFENLPS